MGIIEINDDTRLPTVSREVNATHLAYEGRVVDDSLADRVQHHPTQERVIAVLHTREQSSVC
jgi:hypothetical protein